MFTKYFVFSIAIAIALFVNSIPATASSNLVTYTDQQNGFSLQYPDYWAVDETPATIKSTLDDSIGILNAEGLDTTPEDRLEVMIHVDGSPKYLSNIVVIASPLGSGFTSSQDALDAVKSDFEQNKSSGSYFSRILISAKAMLMYTVNRSVNRASATRFASRFTSPQAKPPPI